MYKQGSGDRKRVPVKCKNGACCVSDTLMANKAANEGGVAGGACRQNDLAGSRRRGGTGSQLWGNGRGWIKGRGRAGQVVPPVNCGQWTWLGAIKGGGRGGGGSPVLPQTDPPTVCHPSMLVAHQTASLQACISPSLTTIHAKPRGIRSLLPTPIVIVPRSRAPSLGPLALLFCPLTFGLLVCCPPDTALLPPHRCTLLPWPPDLAFLPPHLCTFDCTELFRAAKRIVAEAMGVLQQSNQGGRNGEMCRKAATHATKAACRLPQHRHLFEALPKDPHPSAHTMSTPALAPVHRSACCRGSRRTPCPSAAPPLAQTLCSCPRLPAPAPRPDAAASRACQCRGQAAIPCAAAAACLS
eukprot:358515-Chlamydomonas_euryale.AAC.2